ncbi:MAG: tyrosine-protein phosphatase [Planctomycetia bacterium]|nr:tyrosine-protein phosphatase [Planctomycetia bacterium]
MPDDGPVDIRIRPNHRRRIVLGALGAILLLTTYSFQRPLFRGNFGVVEAGKVYRSAQPRGGLAGLIGGRKLLSILNLRGGTPADPFYADELRISANRGVDFYDFPMSATRRPTRRELLALIDLFGRCRYPLLIHCKSGADRTGLASALYLMAGQGVGPEKAIRAFSLDYGHVGLYGTERLHKPIVEYNTWLKTRGLAHTPGRFRRWVETDYESPERSRDFRPMRPGPRDSVAAKLKAGGREPYSR